MAADTAASCAAATLATYVDGTFAARWSEAAATLAIAEARTGEPFAISFVPLIGHPAEGLRRVRQAPCAAACLTVFGNVVRLDIPSEERTPIRATLAVACCSNITLLRQRDGRVHRGLQSDGLLTELLREWADLVQCPSCSASALVGMSAHIGAEPTIVRL